MTASSATYRSELSDRIRRSFADADPRIAAAFEKTPREWFINRRYDQHGIQWIERQAKDEEPAAWLASLYETDAVCISVTNDGLPRSSSTSVDLMIVMILHAGITEGDRILEIGTGTGYNAAILAEMVGPTGKVVSTEIIPEFAAEAGEALRRFHPALPVSVLTGDGLRSGFLSERFDRAIVTGSHDRVPGSLLAIVDGPIVMDLRGSLAGALLTLGPAEGEKRIGALSPLKGAFMALHRGAPTSPEVIHNGPSTAVAILDEVATLIDDLNGPFGFWWQWQASSPVLQRRRSKGQRTPPRYLLRMGEETVTFGQLALDEPWTAFSSGDGQAWHRLVEARSLWHSAGSPALENLRVDVDRAGHQFIVPDDGACHLPVVSLPSE